MILVVLLVICIVNVARFYWKIRKYPPGPFPIPVFGNAFQIDPKTLHLDLERFYKKYGDVFTIWLMDRPTVVFYKDQVIREAMITKGDYFLDRQGEFPETIFQCMENGGVILSSGPSWKEQRRTALQILHDFGVGRNIIEDLVHVELEKCVERIRSSDMKALDIHWPVQVTIANIINQLLYGFSYKHSDCDRVMTYATTLNSVMSGIWDSPMMVLALVFPFVRHLPIIGYQAVGCHIAKYNWCLDFVKEDIETALDGYDKQTDPNCLVQAYVQKMEQNNMLSMVQLSNVCADFFLAGMETTSTTLRWAVLFLAQNQDAQNKLRKEVASVVGFSRLPSLRDKNHMPYTTAAIAELQRCSNVLPISIFHKCAKDITVGGRLIPAGTSVIPHIWAALRDSNTFKNPEQFDPERYFKKDGSLDQEMLNMVISFGVGKRQCAGESLARAELFLGLTTFVQKFHFYPPTDSPLDFTPVYGTILFPKTNRLRVTEVDPLNF